MREITKPEELKHEQYYWLVSRHDNHKKIGQCCIRSTGWISIQSVWAHNDNPQAWKMWRVFEIEEPDLSEPEESVQDRNSVIVHEPTSRYFAGREKEKIIWTVFPWKAKPLTADECYEMLDSGLFTERGVKGIILGRQD